MKKIIIILLLININVSRIPAQLTGPLNMTSAQSNFSQYLSRSAVKSTENNGNQNAALEVFNNTENTMGERFLFNTWVDGGNLINTQNQLINTASYLFNFDKLTGGLLVTQNKADIMSVSPDKISSFILENKGKKYQFLHVAAIDSAKFFLKLAGVNTLYSLYKDCKVKFVKSDFKDDGIIQSGKPYDEYVDESQYNITKPNSSTSRIITLKPQDIKNTLVVKKEQVKNYFSQHKNDVIDENFLVKLINYINQ